MGKKNQQTTTRDPVADIIAEAKESILDIGIGGDGLPDETPPVVDVPSSLATRAIDLDVLITKLRGASSSIRAHGPAVASALEGPLAMIDEVVAELDGQ